jgi:hypothetical protein
MKKLLILLLMLGVSALSRAEITNPPSVEDNLREMDKDRNGMVTVSEVRAYLESKHGKDYEKSTLDKLQSFEGGASCGTPFAQPFY